MNQGVPCCGKMWVGLLVAPALVEVPALVGTSCGEAGLAAPGGGTATAAEEACDLGASSDLGGHPAEPET